MSESISLTPAASQTSRRPSTSSAVRATTTWLGCVPGVGCGAARRDGLMLMMRYSRVMSPDGAVLAVGVALIAVHGWAGAAAFSPQPFGVVVAGRHATGPGPGQQGHAEEERDTGCQAYVPGGHPDQVGRAGPGGGVGRILGALDLVHPHCGARTDAQQVSERARCMNRDHRARHDHALSRREHQRCHQVVSEYRRHGGDARVSGFADADDTTSEQSLLYLRQPGPYVVVPADRPSPPRHGQCAFRADGEHSWPLKRLTQFADVLGPQFDIGINVEPGEAVGSAVSGGQGLALGGDGDGEHPNRRAEGGSHLGGVVVAAVGHHEYVEFTLLGRGDELTEEAPYHLCFIMCGYDNPQHVRFPPRAPDSAGRALTPMPLCVLWYK